MPPLGLEVDLSAPNRAAAEIPARQITTGARSLQLTPSPLAGEGGGEGENGQSPVMGLGRWPNGIAPGGSLNLFGLTPLILLANSGRH